MDFPIKEDIRKAKAEVAEIHKWNKWRRQVGETANKVMLLTMLAVTIVMAIVVLWPKH